MGMKFTEEMLAEDEKRWGARDVITELGYCGNHMRDRKDMTNLDIRFYAYIMRKAHEMLKAQEPRVMTLDEVIQSEGAFWLEYIEEDSDYLCCWGYAFFSCASQNVIELIVRDGYRPLYSFIRSEYGVRWRCWTSRPDKKVRTDTPWADN